MTTQDLYNMVAMAVATYVKVNMKKLQHQRLQVEFNKRWPAQHEHAENVMRKIETDLDMLGETIRNTITP